MCNFTRFRKISVVGLCMLLSYGLSSAQTGAGSSIIDNGYRSTSASDTTFEYAETIYIGPNAVWSINGVHTLFCKTIWIAPQASITGSGKLIIANPDLNPVYPDMPSGTTQIDANNNGNGVTGQAIGLRIELHTPYNLVLEDISDPGFGTVNPSDSLAAALNLSDLYLMVNDGDVLLNGYNLRFDPGYWIHGFSANRMVVTGNSIRGHLVHTGNGSRTAPIGIAEGDYTPVEFETLSSGNAYFSVTDYATASATITAPQEGMNRAWHIYADAPFSGNLTLHHNVASDGLDYDDANAFITQYQGGDTWSSSALADYVGPGTHSSATIAALIPAIGSADGSWFSKSSEAETPLPVTLISFEAYKYGNSAILEWATASEHHNSGFDIERSADGHTWIPIGWVPSLSGSGYSTRRLDYKFTDAELHFGPNYYRLKQIDFDGKYEYSTLRVVYHTPFSNGISLYPNPSENRVFIDGLEGGETISLYNNVGQLLQRFQTNEEKQMLHLDQLPADTYHITVTDRRGTIRSTHQVVKL